MPRSTRRNNQPGIDSKPARRPQRPNPRARTYWIVAFLAVVVFASGIWIVQTVSHPSGWQFSDAIGPADARTMLGSGAVIVDVRTREEYIAGHIEESLWMPLEDLNSLLSTLPRDRLIITVCRTGVRSAQARDMIRESGIQQVTSMKGGMEAWIAAGLPVVYGEPAGDK
jgi:rhodanese-related sulfurtransferase